MRVARGLFRLWIVGAVLWIGAVGVVTWSMLPVDDWTVVDERPSPDRPWLNDPVVAPSPNNPLSWGAIPIAPADKNDGPWRNYQIAERWGIMRKGALAAFIPPVGILAFGAALAWAIRGFR